MSAEGEWTPDEPRKHRGVLILVLGILSFVVCPLVGLVGAILGRSELKGMREGTVDRSGRGLTQAGVVCGIVGFALSTLILALGLLAALVVPNVMRNLGEAQEGRIRADLSVIQSAVEEYRVLNAGRLPENLEELATPDASGVSYFRNNRVPADPWGREYLYELSPDGLRYELFSLGLDGLPGGEGQARDVYAPRPPAGWDRER
jgi:general secretion pathway protein G